MCLLCLTAVKMLTASPFNLDWTAFSARREMRFSVWLNLRLFSAMSTTFCFKLFALFVPLGSQTPSQCVCVCV